MTPHPRSASKNLKKGRRIRSRMALERRHLEKGRITVRSVLEDPEMCSLGRLQVFVLLSCAPKLGKKGARRILEELGVWPLEKVRDLSKFDRDRILDALPSRVH